MTDNRTSNAELATELCSIPLGGHLCLFYEKDPAEQMPAIVLFVQDSLRQDERFVYVADDQSVDQLAGHLRESGINVETETRHGRLALWSRKEWRQPGELDSTKKAQQVRNIIEQASESGFKGIRFAVEMTWTLGPDISPKKLEHWEATINTLFQPDFPGRIICQYNRSRLSPEIMLGALHTHPVAILGQEVYPNHFYQAPLILDGNASGSGDFQGNEEHRESNEARLDWMLSQMQRARQAEKHRIEAEVLRRNNQQLLQAREELTRTNQDLERRVEERTASLRETVTQMEDFAYIVSHDLRAPVRAMQGFALAVLEDHEEKLDDCGRDYLKRIVRGSERMDRLIKDLLTYSRVARREIEIRPVSLQRLVSDVVQQSSDLQRSRAEITIRGELLPVQAHEPSLSQAVSNLLTNAVKFVAPGVIPKIQIWTEAQDDKVKLWIHDNGIGIKPEHQARLFRMFVRLNPEPAYEGTGIGLAIVRKVVERMGGKSGVSSDGVNGSSFWLELPRAETLGEVRTDANSQECELSHLPK